eukprot:TRINITY_DN4190_c0_g2_i4.p2 TRINITY_DN4190_c0_g2~~TRINITY_DN4190_c0_g2_i4.p2  ORF type:complete len:144 (+),score=58.52 TRINITY_DN4190_c0_g2_i4:271-702(+)
MAIMNQEPRQTTSNLGHLKKPSVAALIHGLNRHYYSMVIGYKKSELEQRMLLNLNKKNWSNGLTLTDFEEHDKSNQESVEEMLELSKQYTKMVQEENTMTRKEFDLAQVGKTNPKKHLTEKVNSLMSQNISQILGSMLDSVVF